MAEPITTALIVGLAVGKFVEGASSEAGKKLVGQLWDTIATRFKGRPKVEEAIAQIVASQDQVAITKLEKVLDGEFVEDEKFEVELKGLAQQIINIQNQSQSQVSFEIDARDNARVNAIGGNINATTVDFGDKRP